MHAHSNTFFRRKIHSHLRERLESAIPLFHHRPYSIQVVVFVIQFPQLIQRSNNRKEGEMPLVHLAPKTPEVEEVLAGRMSEIRLRLKGVIHQISGFPENDIIVELHNCIVRNPDPDGADVVVHADTCPEKDLEAHANELREEMARVFIELGLLAHLWIEIWLKFLPGPWCLIKDREIVDRVGHPRD